MYGFNHSQHRGSRPPFKHNNNNKGFNGPSPPIKNSWTASSMPNSSSSACVHTPTNKAWILFNESWYRNTKLHRTRNITSINKLLPKYRELGLSLPPNTYCLILFPPTLPLISAHVSNCPKISSHPFSDKRWSAYTMMNSVNRLLRLARRA